jgi:hypothetical protein
MTGEKDMSESFESQSSMGDGMIGSRSGMSGTFSQLSSESEPDLYGWMFLTPTDSRARGPIQGVFGRAGTGLLARGNSAKLDVT